MTVSEWPIVMCTSTLLADPIGSCSEGELTAGVEASAAAGCDGTSLWSLHASYVNDDGMDLDAVRRLHERLGVRVALVEAVIGWATSVDDAAAVADARPAIDLAASLGADVVAATTLEQEVHPDAATRLAAVCDAAAEQGLRVAFEFLPWTAFPDLRSGWELTQRTGRENAGILLDAMHWQRQPGGPDEATLRSIPGDRIHVFQICDVEAASGDDVLHEAMTGRLVPGEGAVDLEGLIAALVYIGAEPLVAPEVFSTDLLADGPEAMARSVVDGTRRVLARARG